MAAERTEILQLVVGMVDAAPGADILLELEGIIDAGLTIEELAIAISENPAWSGDTGLFPDFLPNAIFAQNFMTQLVGSEVTATALTESIDAMTADLNAGTSRGAAMNAAIDALAASTDPDFADAAAALANKTAVATYYSVDVEQSSADLADLIAVVSGVDSSATAVATGTAAVDQAIADAIPFVLTTSLDALTTANTALATFLAANATTAADVVTAEGAYDGMVLNSGIAGDSPAFIAALLAAEVIRNDGDLTVANTALSDANTLIAAVPGLAAAVTASAVTAVTLASATNAAGQAVIDLNAAEATYILNDAGASALAAIPDTAVAAVLDGNGDSIIGTVGGVLVLDADPAGDSSVAAVTEATHPGITALMASIAANNAAILAATAATNADTAAIALVDRLDTEDGADATALAAIGAAMTQATPADADYPTIAEVATEEAALLAGITSLDAQIGAVTQATADDAGDLEAYTAVAALLDAAEAANYISTADNTAILAAFGVLDTDNADTDQNGAPVAGGVLLAAAIGLAQTELGDDTTGNSNAASDFTDLLTTHAGTTGATNPLTAGIAALEGTAEAAEDAITDLAAAIVDIADAEALVVDEAALVAVVADAEAAFTDEGLLVPVNVDAAKLALTGDDIFTATTAAATGSVANFDLLGDDLLYIGSDYTLNTNTTALAGGDDAVLEVWITDNAGSTVITLEDEIFSSSTNATEITITLTGVAVADVSLDGGIITLA